MRVSAVVAGVLKVVDGRVKGNDKPSVLVEVVVVDVVVVVVVVGVVTAVDAIVVDDEVVDAVEALALAIMTGSGVNSTGSFKFSNPALDLNFANPLFLGAKVKCNGSWNCSVDSSVLLSTDSLVLSTDSVVLST